MKGKLKSPLTTITVSVETHRKLTRLRGKKPGRSRPIIHESYDDVVGRLLKGEKVERKEERVGEPRGI